MAHVHSHSPLTAEELFCIEGCRSFAQYHKMRNSFELGHCEFCSLDPAVNVILFEDDYVQCWSVPSAFLRKELKHHLVVIPKRHVRYPWDLMYIEHVSIAKAMEYLAGQYNLAGGIVATRFGDMELNAGTVPHLHTNIMVPNGTAEVRIPVFKDPADRVHNQARAAEFARRYEAHEIP